MNIATELEAIAKKIDDEIYYDAPDSPYDGGATAVGWHGACNNISVILRARSLALIASSQNVSGNENGNLLHEHGHNYAHHKEQNETDDSLTGPFELNENALERAYNAAFVPESDNARIAIRHAIRAYLFALVDESSYGDLIASGGLPEALAPPARQRGENLDGSTSGDLRERDTSRAAFEKDWNNRPWLTEEESDKDRAFRWWQAGSSAAVLSALPGRDEEEVRADERERCAKIANNRAAEWRLQEKNWKRNGGDLTSEFTSRACSQRADALEGLAAAMRSLKTGSAK
jgi:hypothetical protein